MSELSNQFIEDLKIILNFIEHYRLRENYYCNKCFCINALPEPDFRYFSNSKALYLSTKAQYKIRSTGGLGFVAGTYPFW